MKKFVVRYSSLVLTAFLVQSCYSPKFMVDDDVYVMRNSTIGVGESTSDETTYASYRKQRDNRSVSSNFYHDDMLRHHQRSRFWHMGMGFNNMCYRPGFGSSVYFGTPYYSPYMYGGINPIYMVDPFGCPYPYGFMPMAYDPWFYGYTNFYGYSPWYGPGWNNNAWNMNHFGVSNPTVYFNHHSGPRGSLSGIGNPGGRSSGTAVVKSVQSPNNTGYSQNASGNIRQKRIDNTTNVGQSIRETSTVKPNAPVTVQSVRQNRLTPTTDRNIRPSGTPAVNSPGRPGLNNSTSPGRNNNSPSRMENPGTRINNNRPSGTGSGGNIGGGRSGGAPASGGGRRN